MSTDYVISSIKIQDVKNFYCK